MPLKENITESPNHKVVSIDLRYVFLLGTF